MSDAYSGEVVLAEVVPDVLAESRRVQKRIGQLMLLSSLSLGGLFVAIVSGLLEFLLPLAPLCLLAAIFLLPASFVFMLRRVRGTWQSDLRRNVLWAILISFLSVFGGFIAFFTICTVVVLSSGGF
jgi:hypothetical protein